jgi:GNAT superfamily N-acetyltransferase
MLLRPLLPEDRPEFSKMLYQSFNVWYRLHGWPSDYFKCKPEETGIFFDIYSDLTPGCSIAAFDPETGRMMGACFYHPRETHVSLGIMAVHPDYFKRGIGKAFVRHILDFSSKNGYRSLRLVGSAMNIDSFSLYNKAGLVPRAVYHDMILTVPEYGMQESSLDAVYVRDASFDDIPAIGSLEIDVSGIRREIDYRYCIENTRGYLHISVLERSSGRIDGFMASLRHPALNMLGPCVARTEADAAALILREADCFRGRTVLCLIPMDKRKLVEQMYKWGARNCETHLVQVRGEFKPFDGISMPSFLPETG